MGAILKLRSLSIQRGDKILISGLDCELAAGGITVVLGPNGAGKSSLLLAIAGLIPANGTIEVDGSPLAAYGREELTRRIAWQGDLPPTEFGLTVRQRLELAANESAERIDAIAEAMDIALLLMRPLGKLSSGERQRCELAALMLRNAPLWLLDEPTAHLDLKHQIKAMQMLRAERDAGRSIITVLHDIQQAMAVADQLILVDGQGGVEYGEAAALFECGRLGRLFDAPLQQQGEILIPDYGAKR